MFTNLVGPGGLVVLAFDTKFGFVGLVMFVLIVPFVVPPDVDIVSGLVSLVSLVSLVMVEILSVVVCLGSSGFCDSCSLPSCMR